MCLEIVFGDVGPRAGRAGCGCIAGAGLAGLAGCGRLSANGSETSLRVEPWVKGKVADIERVRSISKQTAE